MHASPPVHVFSPVRAAGRRTYVGYFAPPARTPFLRNNPQKTHIIPLIFKNLAIVNEK
jgi:hypothetical protein